MSSGSARLVACLCLGAALSAGTLRADVPDPEQVRAEGIVGAYQRATGWPVKALALLSLGERFHPAGAAIFVDAIESGDPRLRVYALETLRSMAHEDLRRVLTADLVGALVQWQRRIKNDRVRLQVLLLLAGAFPQVAVRTPHEWQQWWDEVKALYEPDPWPPYAPPPPRPGEESKTVPAPSILDRAFDLSQGGIQLALVVDSTGSMMPTIEAVKLGLTDLVEILSGLTEDLEIGLVHYRDLEDFGRRGGAPKPGDGADELCRLTKSTAQVQARLDRLTAEGGGDYPERVSAGLWRALQPRMGWDADANKMVMIIGDAPPKDVRAAETLAREAHDEPETFLPRRAVPTGPGRVDRPRPFVVSTVAVDMGAVLGETARAFRQISAAGGGVHVRFDASQEPEQASAAIVHRLVELSFGEKYMAEAARFVSLYFQYRSAGYLE